MQAPGNKSFIYEFEGFVLDPQERSLTIEGAPVHLPAREFDTLLYLVENSGRALTKKEMLSAIWHDAFVEEVNLAKQISRLRKVFNNAGTELIETIPKHGYRFKVSDLRRRESDPFEPVIIEKRTVRRVKVTGTFPREEAPLLPAAPPSTHRYRWIFVAAAVAVVLMGGAYIYLQTGPKAKIESMAVLPFATVGDDTDAEYLSDGVSDSLINSLSQIPNLRMIARTSAQRYRGRDVDPLTVSRELGVQALLTGRIVRRGDSFAISAELTDARDNSHIWGGQYNARLADLLAVQHQMVGDIAEKLRSPLTREERQRVMRVHTGSPEAYQLYVKGRYFWNKRTVEGLRKAIDLFNEAVERDPSYALAYVGLADSYSLMSEYDGLPPKDTYPKARNAAETALELDDTLAEAHAALGFIKAAYDWDWPGAEREYRRAIELDQNYGTAHQWYAEYLSGMGRHDEALAEIRRAKVVDPVSLIINAVEAWVLYHARDYDRSIAQAQKVVEMDPSFAEAYEYLKRCYDEKGMYREAIAARQMRRKLAGYNAEMTPTLREAAGAASPVFYWRKRLEQDIEESKQEPATPFDMAEIHARLGNKDEAFAALRSAYEERSFLMMYLKVAPMLDPIRSDPRYADLVRRVGLQG